MGREQAPKRRREVLRVWGPIAAVVLVGFVVAYLFVPEKPPKSIRIATGDPTGAYHAFAMRYRERLAKEGFTLEVVETRGSIDNLRLLRERQVDFAFVQGGTAGPEDKQRLQAIGSLYFEPLWVFHRGPDSVDRLTAFAGKRLAVGPVGSGTRALALQVLADEGVAEDPALHVPLGAREGAAALRAGTVDAAFLVASPRSAVVVELLGAEGVQLVSFKRHEAYRRHHAFLSSVALTEGTVDLRRNLPPWDTTLLAASAMLVAREEVHPALVPLLLEAATDVHEAGGLFEDPGAFPSERYLDLPLHGEARRYLRSGPSFLQRWLPFWLANTLDRLKILLLPLLTLMLPLARFAPPVYNWTMRKKVYRWYEQLREIDQHLIQAKRVEDPRPYEERLDGLEAELSKVSVPLSYMQEFYNLKLHVDLIRSRLRQGTG